MGLLIVNNDMSTEQTKFQFAVDRGGTFTDVFARCPGGKIRVLKLLSEDPQHYNDAPIEGIRRILQEVWRCIYKPSERAKKEEYERKQIIVKELCKKHIKHRNDLNEKKKISTDSKLTEDFVHTLPQREVLKIATKRWLAADMKKFVIKPVQEQIEEKQPLEYLTEMREVTIQFINIVPKSLSTTNLVVMVNDAYKIVCKIVNKLLGVVNKASLFDKDVMILVLFGLRGIKHELESQNALRSGHYILESLSKLEGVERVSVGVTNGLVYCGVVGHPLRKEYTVIGAAVNKAARLMCAFESKVTCDYKTFKKSKLSSYYFQVQSAINLKGIEDAGHIFEYNQNFDEPNSFEPSLLPIIGREAELELINNVIQKRHEMEEYSGVCFYGKQKTGKTKILEAAAMQYRKKGYTVTAVCLTSAALRPYFCVSLIYRQLYDRQTSLSYHNIANNNHCNSNNSLSAMQTLPPDLWDLNEILQKGSLEPALKKAKVTALFQDICCDPRNKITAIFIDDINFIDSRSLEVILSVLSNDNVKLFCAGHFEEDTWDVQWELSKSRRVKMLYVSSMDSDDIPAICCQFLKTRGVSKKLIALIEKTCEGRPGWIQSCLLRLVNNGCIEVKFVASIDEKIHMYVFPDLKLLYPKCNSKLLSSNWNTASLAVAHLDDNFNEYSDELTLAAISLDLFDSFPPYQQLIIKTGAVLGDMFSRSLLFVMLKYPNEQIFANAIMNLFEEEVLDCGTRYVSSGTLISKKLCCYCFLEDEDFLHGRRKSIELPRYAFCKLLHFKNKNLRVVAYDLLPANQRKELHLRITHVLENQNNACPNCLRDDSTAIIRLRTFKQMVQHSLNPNTNYRHFLSSSNIKSNPPLHTRNIIREAIGKELQTPSLFDGQIKVKVITPFKRKIWDPSTCFCLEILTRVYADLIYHSDQAGHLGKKIFYLMQYGVILITLGEFKDCIPVLTEASELCTMYGDNGDDVVYETFRKLHMGKIHMLLAESYFRLGDIPVSKIHATISLRQYNVPLMSLKYKIPHLFLNRPKLFNRGGHPLIGRGNHNTMMDSDFGMCMNLMSNIFASEGKWEMAQKAAERSLHLLQYANPNTTMLCDAYAKAIELYNMFGDGHAFERLERSIGREVMRNYTSNAIMELYSICKLMLVIFKIRIMHGHIKDAIRISYRAIDLCFQIQAYFLQVEIIPLMASALLMRKKIESAVSTIKLLFTIGQTIDESILIDYYGFCVELNVETSFSLEPMEKCADFASQYFLKQINKPVYTDRENKIIVYLHIHYLRNGKWSDALKWKTLIKFDTIQLNSFVMASTYIKFTESMLMTLVWNITTEKAFIEVEEKRMETQLKQCKKLAKKWVLFMPRYLHYTAFYKKIMNKNRSVNNYLRKSEKLAKKQGNILEICWVKQSRIIWSGGVNFGNDMKDINWKLARTYSLNEWTSILYGLSHEIETGQALDNDGNVDSSLIEWIRMGTTVATNALLERRGEKMALVINKNFKDLLLIGNQARPSIFELDIQRPEVLYSDVVEVNCRVIPALIGKCELGEKSVEWKVVEGNTGDKLYIINDLNREEIRQDLRRVKNNGINSIAVALAHSYMYAEHEKEIGKIAEELGFSHVSLSHEVMPMVRLVPRGFTASADAYLTPIVKRYVQGFSKGFKNNLKGTRVLFMQSDGGLTPMNNFNGARAILSGPAGGVVGYAMTTWQKETDLPVIGFDMGGTSTDVSRFAGRFEHVYESTTAGVTIQAPHLDINTVAAGGGSMLFFRSGLFVVGPESAGAHPGPVCYKKGGNLTVTDANLVLRRLLPEYFPKIFGPNEDSPLDEEATLIEFKKLTREINIFQKEQRVKNKKLMTLEEVAMGFVQVANEAMCRPIRALTQAKGYDTSRHALACFGGAGAQHACAIARSLGMSIVFVHKYAGILSAYGMALADVVVDKQEPCAKTYESKNFNIFDKRLDDLCNHCVKELKNQGFSESSIACEVYLHMRYDGTDCALMCSPTVTGSGTKYGDFLQSFLDRYNTEFGFIIRGRCVIIDDIRVRGIGKSGITLEAEKLPSTEKPIIERNVRVFFEGGYQLAKVYLLEKLSPGHVIDGPAIIMDKLSTILVEPDCTATISKYGDIKIKIGTGVVRQIGIELDSIQLSIFGHRFMSIAEQMGRILQRTAISTNIKERLDFSCALFGLDGGLVSNAPHIPVHLGAMQESVQFQIKYRSSFKEGDVILTNHPSAGGSHLPDFTVITPVFHHNIKTPIFFVASRGHHSDIGGITPGSMPPHSKTLDEEGVAFKSFLLVENGNFHEEEFTKQILKAGGRNISDNVSDLRAQVAANHKGIALVSELIDQYGLDVVQAYMEHIQANAEVAVRDTLRVIAKESFLRTGSNILEAEDYMDDGSAIRLKVTLNEREGSAVCDFTGSGPEVWGNCNSPKAITLSALIYCLRCMVGYDIPLNQGCLVPVKIIIRKGSILDPSDTAAVVGGNVLTSQRIVDVVLKAFQVCAASQGCMNNITFGNESWGNYETVGGGSGAGPTWEGCSGVHVHMTNTRVTDIEIIERRYPVYLRKFTLRNGSGGAGKFRGGSGVIREYLFRAPLILSVLTERRVLQPYGMAGGMPGERGLNLLIRANGRTINLGPKTTVPVEPGDVFQLCTPGGGGYGKPVAKYGENLIEVKNTKNKKSYLLRGSVHEYRQTQESV